MNRRILLIEDNADMAENIAAILELANYDVVRAGNGKAGVDVACKDAPDLIICDVMMPELDGYGVFHILSKKPETSKIPFVFLTAKSDPADVREGMNLGADDYITKPFDSADLLRAVEVRIKNKSRGAGHSISLFSESSERRDMQRLTEGRPERLFRKKDLLFMEGQAPVDLYFIRSGRVKTYKINYDGKELITGLHRTGDFLGVAPILEAAPYNENAEILEDARLSLIPADDFIQLMYTSRDLARKFVTSMSSSLREMENRLVDVAYQSVRQRVGRMLLSVADHSSDNIITLSRRDLASLVGTATESLNRTLADFRDEQIIALWPEGIKIINKRGLEKLLTI